MNLYKTRSGERENETNWANHHGGKQDPFLSSLSSEWWSDVCRWNTSIHPKSVMAKHLGWFVAWTTQPGTGRETNNLETDEKRNRQHMWLQWNDRFHPKMKKKFNAFVQSKRKQIKQQLGKQD